VSYDVRTEWAAPRRLAAIPAQTSRPRLGTDIIRLLDVIWPVLRERSVQTGHNVVIYHGGGDEAMRVEVGVEIFGDFSGSGEVRPLATPSGEVVTAAHFGEYTQMAGAYAALERWCAANGRRPAGVSWEVYGDWDDEPARRRTDIYFLLEPARG
jgi:effector-binding domain-containing protein